MKSISTHQQGSILLVTLVLLVLMTMIGLSASANVMMQTKIVSNELDRNKAFHAADSGLKQAEAMLFKLGAPVNCPKLSESSEGSNQSPCAASAAHDIIMQPIKDSEETDINWWKTNLKNIIETDGATNIAENVNARYAVEIVKRIPNSLSIGTTSAQFYDEMYRVTSQGIGETEANAVVLQTIFFARN